MDTMKSPVGLQMQGEMGIYMVAGSTRCPQTAQSARLLTQGPADLPDDPMGRMMAEQIKVRNSQLLASTLLNACAAEQGAPAVGFPSFVR